MTPQLMLQIAQDAIKLYKQGYRVSGTNQFFELRAVATVTKGEVIVSECFEKAAILFAIEECCDELFDDADGG